MQTLPKAALGLFAAAMSLTSLGMAGQRVEAAGATPADYGYATPAPDPALPAGMNTFTPPLLGTAAGPRVAEWTRSGQPGDTITVAGPDFTTSTQFELYGQTTASNAVAFDRLVNTADGTATCVVLPSALPAWSTYLLWPINGSTMGMPVGVNRTDAWWVGPNEAVAGQTVAVFGRNLSQNNTATGSSWIYIKPVGDYAGQWATPTSVNPYKVAFTLPNLAAGNYEVWTNNGAAGDFGWSGPLTLTVLAASPFAGQSSNVFNVKNYGATGNGTTDDAPAILSAFSAAAAAAPAEVYFPAGTYACDEPLFVRSNVSWVGAGASTTTIEPGPGFDTGGNGYVLISNRQYGSTGNFMFSGLTITWNGNPNIVSADRQFLELIDQNWVTIAGCTLNYKTVGGEYIAQCNDFVTSGCTIIGDNWGPFIGCSNVSLTGNAFYGTDQGGGFTGFEGGSGYDIEDNTVQDYDPTESTAGGICEGRLIATNGNNGNNTDVYVAGNTTINAGPPSSGLEDGNGGEQVLFEMGSPFAALSPTSATATTATFSTALAAQTSESDVMIISGLGTGEARHITAVSGDTVTVSPAWTIIPNSASVLAIGVSQSCTVAYNNSLNGKSNYASYDSAVVGTEWYGDCWNDIFADNKLTDIRGGLLSEFTQCPDSGSPTPSAEYFNLVTNNTLNGSYNGVEITDNALFQNEPGTFGHLGNTIRWNSATGIANAGLIFTGTSETEQWTGGNLDFELLEDNTLTNVPVGVEVTPYNTLFSNIVLYDNTFDLGSAPYSGSIALNVTGTTTTFWRSGDVWSGFQTGATDTDTVPGAVSVFAAVPAPKISPAAGVYLRQVPITITCSYGAAAIKYTTDGSDPATSGTAHIYSRSFTLTGSAKVRAVAEVADYANSPEASAAYTVRDGPPGRRALDDDGGRLPQ